jgi:hypothetical protein
VLAPKAFQPTAVSSEPVVLESSAPPSAVLRVPVVLSLKALLPTAVLLDAVVFTNKASLPIAVLSAAPSEPSPTAVLLEAVVLA